MSITEKQFRGSTTVLAVASLIFAWLIVAGLAFFGDELLRVYIARPTPPVVIHKEELAIAPIQMPKAEPVTVQAAANPTVIAPPPLRIEAKQAASQSFLTSAGVITWTNLNREQNNLPPLLEHRLLDQAAQLKLDDMFKKQYFAHESPEGEGPGEVVAKTGFVYLAVGENLALGDFDNDENLVNGWMNSPGHRANILHQTFTHIGLAVGKARYEGRETWMAVQEFGVPKSVCTEPDAALLGNIDSQTAELAARLEALNQRQAEIEAMNPRQDTDAYNAKASEFNALADEYNALAAAEKATVSRYNEDAHAFNACVARYTGT